MAISKEAPILPNICVVAAASREALAAAVAELTETIASLPVTTIKRRLRDAEFVLPFENGAVAAAANGFSHATIECLDPKPETEGLEKK